MPQIIHKLSSIAAWMVLALVGLTAFVFMFQASFGDSAITDELAHIPAGYAYVHNLDYRLNPEHPPLVKALAGLPLLFLNLNFPTSASSWTTDVNGQWDMGTRFLYQSGNDANTILRFARLGPILLTLLLIALIYLWSKELMGKFWALLPAVLFGLSPNVLAHGHYVTTDVAAAFGIVLATHYFLKLLFLPTKKNLWCAGISLGIAEISKFSAVLLIPYFAFLLVVFYLSTTRELEGGDPILKKKRYLARAKQYMKRLVLVFAIGYGLVVYPVYALFTLRYPQPKQTADTTFILTSFAGGQTPAGHFCKPVRCVADLDIWMTKNPVTRPVAEYLLGVLMVIQRSAGGNTAYFLGEVSSVGSRYYFPTVYTLKESLPVLIMIFVGLALALWSMIRKTVRVRGRIKNIFLDYLGTNFTEFSMISFVVFYWGYSMRSPLNIGVRHLFPTLPFIYILTAGVWKRWVLNINWLKLKAIIKSGAKYLFLMFLVLWFLTETVFTAPYFLSYFNPFGGGVAYGYRYVTDSNYDWGQDLLRLKNFLDHHPEIDKIGVDYFGGGNPKYYLEGKEENWWSSRGNPTSQNIHWLAVSINTLQGALEPLAPSQGRKAEDEYRWLTELRPPEPGLGNVPKPDFRAGTSIFIYKL